jgi:hypothetical protein
MRTTSGAMGTATGSDNAFIHLLDPVSSLVSGPKDTQALVAALGSFSGGTIFAIDGLMRGTDSTWIPLSMVNRKTKVRSNGSEAVADNTTTAWQVECGGCSKLRIYPSAGTPTAPTAVVTSGEDKDFGASGGIVQVSNAALSTFGAGIAFAGGTGANVVTIPDNLADAMNIKEGTNSYIKIVTTDAGETVVITPLATLLAGISFGGATGTNLLKLVDNLANALEIKEGANSYIKIATADGAEAITMGKMPRIPTTTVAATGSNQGGAAALIEGGNQVTGADDAKGVILPSAVAGMIVLVKSTVAGKILKVYPNTSDAINAITADSPISLASGPTPALFWAFDATTWYTIPLLPS